MLVRFVDEVGDDLRDVGDRRHLVRVERLRQHRSGAWIQQSFLRERVPDSLDDAALDLARGLPRADHTADVVDRGDALDAYLPGLDVDCALCDVAPQGEDVHPRWVRSPRALA